MIATKPNKLLSLIQKFEPTTLSTFFDKDTVYFYGYPSGSDSGFLNLVPPYIEELVAARPALCAGPTTKMICFASTQAPAIDNELLRSLKLDVLPRKQIITFSKNITTDVNGTLRNAMVKQDLLNFVEPGTLVMAQPFMDPKLKHLYQINPETTLYLNDKKNMHEYIPEQLRPDHFGEFKDGMELYSKRSTLSVPCVVKVSSSSAGDGVFICKTNKDLQEALETLKSTKTTIFVEQFIEEIKNYGLQFGIPSNPKKQIEILGVNEQVTSTAGEFLGGIIESTAIPDMLKNTVALIREKVLPIVRTMGWHGVGCFDILVDKNFKSYIIDCNFRMTGMTVMILMKKNRVIKKKLLSFSGEFQGTQKDFKEKVASLAVNHKKPVIFISTLSKNSDIWRFNGAVLYDKKKELKSNINKLLDNSISSGALEVIKKRLFYEAT